MDEQEAEYLRQHIRDLERSRGCWKTVALVSLAFLALVILIGGFTTVALGLVTGQRMRMEEMRAREAEMEARMQAEQARQAELEARKKAEQVKQADMEMMKRLEEARLTKENEVKPGAGKTEPKGK